MDTGLHYCDWSRDKAIQFMRDNTLLTEEARIESEVDRYITWPGQATSYKIGEQVIWRLRHEREEALGGTFDVKEFHGDVLNCMGPLNLLNDCIKIQEESRSRKSSNETPKL